MTIRHRLPGLAAIPLILGFLLMPAVASATPIVDVHLSIGPEMFASASYADYLANAQVGLLNDLPTYGDSGLPSYFYTVPDGAAFTSNNFIVSNFPSWLGSAYPGVVFGPDFADEYGHRPLTFAMVTDSLDGMVNINRGLNIAITSDNLGSHQIMFNQYSTTAVASGTVPVAWGVNKGLDDILGTDDDERVTSGTGEVDAILAYYGLGWPVYEDYIRTHQQIINEDGLEALLPYLPATWNSTVTYSQSYSTGMENTIIASGYIPEPATFSLLGLGTLALAAYRRRRRM